MTYLFVVKDSTGREIHLTKERWKHIQKHPSMHNQEENIQNTITNSTTMRYDENRINVLYFYKEFKERDASERYLLVAVKYLNGKGFVITSFFTNKITGEKWQKT